MHLQYAQKADYTERLRRYISQQVADAQETQRADASFTALSYQSRSHPNRHVWIETDEQGMTLDLEDWAIQDAEHYVVQSADVESVDEALTLVKDWFSNIDAVYETMFTIHALRAGRHVILSEEEFSTLIRQFLTFQPVEVIEEQVPNIEIEHDLLTYCDAFVNKK